MDGEMGLDEAPPANRQTRECRGYGPGRFGQVKLGLYHVPPAVALIFHRSPWAIFTQSSYGF